MGLIWKNNSQWRGDNWVGTNALTKVEDKGVGFLRKGWQLTGATRGLACVIQDVRVLPPASRMQREQLHLRWVVEFGLK